jgi:hypothetical protein
VLAIDPGTSTCKHRIQSILTGWITTQIHKELQDLDPLCSPHLEEILIGGNIDLDLLSLFPQKYARIMGGMEEGGQVFKVNNGGERNSFRAQPKEEEGVFILLPPKR